MTDGRTDGRRIGDGPSASPVIRKSSLFLHLPIGQTKEGRKEGDAHASGKRTVRQVRPRIGARVLLDRAKGHVVL